MSRTSKKIKSLISVTVGGFVAFTGISVYKNNENFYKNIMMPLVHLMDPEKAHELAIFISKYRLLPKSQYTDPNLLKLTLFDKHFSNPVGIAAGFDKHGEAVEGLKDLGFGFVEVGSVTPNPQMGNEKPRVFRLSEDQAVINRYGFNSDGHEVVYKRLQSLKKNNFKGIVGVNLGKNKTSEDAVEDYVAGIKKFGSVADYLVVNISSPNTPGLRKMQDKEALTKLLSALNIARKEIPESERPPLLLKLAPDLSRGERKDIAEVIMREECRVDGLIVSNTTTERPNSLKNENFKGESGGLSGKPLTSKSTEMISDMFKLTKGMPIIGVGGIFTGEDAYDKIRAGASAVQLYTSVIYDGPPVVTKVKRELAELLAADGFKCVSEAVGVNAAENSMSQQL